MSIKLDQLITERNNLSNMTDEDYDAQNYAQYLIDTYSFFIIILNIYQMDQSNINRMFAIALLSQAIIIYSVLIY